MKSIDDTGTVAIIGNGLQQGHFGLKTGKGISDWSARDDQALLKERADRLFQHLAADAG